MNVFRNLLQGAHNDPIMIIKLIQLAVHAEPRRRFTEGQREWGALRGVTGFCGQTGGWDVEDESRAVIIGFWQTRADYDQFMAHDHDGILAASVQNGTYFSSEITTWSLATDIPGEAADLRAAIGIAGYLRIAECELYPGQRPHFFDVQKAVWNPGMSRAGGLLAGACGERRDSSDRILVCTFWKSESHHSRYRDGVFEELRAQADVERDCAAVTGRLVLIEPTWIVPAGY